MSTSVICGANASSLGATATLKWATSGRGHVDSKLRSASNKVLPNLFQQVAKRKAAGGAIPVVKISCDAGVNPVRPTDGEASPPETPKPPKNTFTPTFAYPQLSVETPGRVVAIGDLHGDLAQTILSLKIAGVIKEDAQGPEDVHWTGGDTHLVQLGDVLDRGDDEIGILLLLQKLQKEAKEAGGAVHLLNGNHEVLNIAGDFRYVTEGAFLESEQFSDGLEEAFGCVEDGVPCDIMANPARRPALDMYEQSIYDKRIGLYAPGGTVAQTLSRSHTVIVVNDTCFVHGGLRRRHAEFGLDKLNMCVCAWMRGEKESIPDIEEALFLAAGSSNSAVWCRTWSEEFVSRQKRVIGAIELKSVLEIISAEVGRPVRRMAMGHTVQRVGINSEYKDLAWRLDVGLSRGVAGASPEVLQILDGEVTVLRAKVPVELGRGFPERMDIEYPDINACSIIDHSYFLRSELPVRPVTPNEDEPLELDEPTEPARVTKPTTEPALSPIKSAVESNKQ
uniref:Calcineurin-like phosphoesterase domain-containing protein n=1 Tax=Pyramimonas obovata TaxID=1411642 RepID=A0A7S0RI63_9CHLO|mmetsp:Transcript_34738/g.75944  ORF Transcript_34738/g.75944 Transcript_34738/m.75944 type:complete len:507 (+) Transcript_34738:240-1760(+)|eukprot:CAMPEP_0118932546 /NCGR_PEP_ID=MMETSP1169-20130426/10484_1 /TAXON_ID=36882 /ORGANISM="Pyramimonas obovata, Strain CCMP722" /LENGTH=506 /DNA_ID=CAMNT_0006875217 /DNA_START=205 /DNA_END=1725 /DNA_ORIENTATION=+